MSALLEFISENHIGDAASIFGVIVALFGFGIISIDINCNGISNHGKGFLMGPFVIIFK